MLPPVTSRILRFLPGDGNSPDSSGAFYPLSDVPPVAPWPGRAVYQLALPGFATIWVCKFCVHSMLHKLAMGKGE